MEKISKIYAVTLDRSERGYGSGGNCKVVSIIRDGKYLSKEEEILKYIETDSKIFSNKIYDFVTELRVGDLIEILPSYINTEIESGRNYYISIQAAKKVGVPVIDVPAEYLSEEFIDLDSISKYLLETNHLKAEFNQIYLCDSQHIFGPFRINNNTLSPIKGKHTYSFEYNINELVEDKALEYIYLIAEPKSKIKAIDCSTPSQLVDFLKSRLSIDRMNLNLLTKIGKEIQDHNQGASELDIIRLRRSEEYVEQINLSLNELYTILSKEDKWSHVIGNIVENYRTEFKDYALLNLSDTIKTLEADVNSKNKILLDTEEKLTAQRDEIIHLERELDTIETKKSDLILNIKLLAGLNNDDKTTKPVEKNSKYFDLISIDNKPTFDNIDDFYDELKEVWQIKVSNKSLYEDGLLILHQNRFLIADNSLYVLNLIYHLGNSEMLIQNAEADWIKFQYWKDNGLEMIHEKACNNPKIKFFYILQDFNIASFECYGKPIIDVSRKIRRSLFEGNSYFPTNLYIILIKADDEIDDFGFQLNKSTFRGWSFLPGIMDVEKIEFPKSDAICLESFLIDRSTKNYSEIYFN